MEEQKPKTPTDNTFHLEKNSTEKQRNIKRFEKRQKVLIPTGQTLYESDPDEYDDLKEMMGF